jgi:hypothetical protein
MNIRRYSLVCALCLACSASAVFAADGVVLIDQNRALAGGITPGDAPGFPVTISLPGSYKLSGNLTLPANTDGIVIAADGVTIDLNGFTITGGGGGTAISDPGGHAGIAIRNGSITHFTFGIVLGGSTNVDRPESSEIQQIRAFNNENTAIVVGSNASVTGNVVTKNVSGIDVGDNAVVSSNTVTHNGTALIVGANSTISGNTLSSNGNGLIVFCPSAVVGNTIQNNVGAILETGSNNCVLANNNPATP